MHVFLAILDPALHELFGLSPEQARLRIERELVLSTLFCKTVRVPDVFLYNNQALHSHILDGRVRSLFGEMLEANILQIVARDQVTDYHASLRLVNEDTLAGVPLKQPIAIQRTSDGVAERLSGVAPHQIFGVLPTTGERSSGESFESRLTERVVALAKSTDSADRRTAADLRWLADQAKSKLSQIDGAGIRRAVIVWTIGQRFSGTVSNQIFYESPYRAILQASPLTSRDLLRREMLEMTYVYLSNLANRYQCILLWPNLGLTPERPDLAMLSQRRIRQIAALPELFLNQAVRLPSLRRLRNLGHDLVALREYGARYFSDVERLHANDPHISQAQVAEDLQDYARMIRRAAGTAQPGPTQVFQVVSGALTVGSGLNPIVGSSSGVFAILSVVANRQRIQRVRVYGSSSA